MDADAMIKIKMLEAENGRLRNELDLRNEEAERLHLDLQAQENTNQEDQIELRRVTAERALLLEQKEQWDDRVHKIAEDNTVIISTVLEQLNRNEAVLEAFQKKVLEMVRRTRRIVMAEGWPAWNEGETGGESDDDIGNVVKVMVSPVERELKEIENALAKTRAS